MTSAQTLSDDQRRTLAGWAAECAERVLPLFVAEAPEDGRVPDALARSRAYARGASSPAAEIALRMVAVKAAASATSPAGAAAARAAAQASGVAHMGAHALGAAGYAVKAVGLAHPGRPDLVEAERAWQIARLTPDARAALAALPPLGTPGGPLGPGLLTNGVIAEVIRAIQADVAAS